MSDKLIRRLETHHSKKQGYFYPTAIRKLERVVNGSVAEIQYQIGYNHYHYGLDFGLWEFIPCFTLDKEEGETAVAWLKAKQSQEDKEKKQKEEYEKKNYTRISEVGGSR